MRKVLKIDKNGLFIEDVLIEVDEQTPADCIEIECPQGFYRPKWDGKSWVEGLTKAEIDAIKAKQTPQPTIAELEQKVVELQTQIDAIKAQS